LGERVLFLPIYCEWIKEVQLGMCLVMPKVSVIIPVYNVEKYLRECLDSILSQTFKDFEVICVDDGSTDASVDILREYADNDDRFILLKQENQGAAAARNYGMSIAKGKYLLFLDSDDVFSEMLLEKSVAKAEFFDADITIFKAMSFDTTSKIKAVMKDGITKFRLGQQKTFSHNDVSDKIFNSFLIPAWNKLFKKSFVFNNKILFQEIKRYNDLFFTNKALTLATKIILLDEVLLFYRVGLKSNLQSGKDDTPLEVHKALFALKRFLDEQGVYEKVKDSFIKLSLDNVFYNLHEIKNDNSRSLYVNKLRDEYFKDLGITEYNNLRNLSYMRYLQYKFLCSSDNRIIQSGLYALDKALEYYKITGLKNTIRKLILKY